MRNILQILTAAGLFVALIFCGGASAPLPGGADSAMQSPLQLDRIEALDGYIGDAQDEKLGPDITNEGTTPIKKVKIYNYAESCVQTLDITEYLIGVLAAEMPASYRIEALKAQAVAARTYLASKQTAKGCARYEKCDICTYSGHCQGYMSKEKRKKRWGDKFETYEEKLSKAVTETQDLVLTYNGKLISAMYHDSSLYSTEDSQAVYGSAQAYLVSVETPEQPNQVSKKVSYLITDFINLVNKEYPGSTLTPENFVKQFKIGETTPSGRVASVQLGKLEVDGSDFRGVVGLRSTEFYFKIIADTVIFTTNGYGHGLGMSQVGANEMAKQGSNYKEILLHYYTGVKLEK